MNGKLNFSQMDFLKFYKNKSKRAELFKKSMLHLSKNQTLMRKFFQSCGLSVFW